MGHLTRIGESVSGFCLLSVFFVPLSYSQPLVCTPSAVPLIIHSEGLSEQVGDVVLDCSGGAPGSRITMNLAVFLTVNLTNKLAGNAVDAQLFVDTGSGPVPGNAGAQRFGSNSAIFNGLSFTVPASGEVKLRIANLRGNATEVSTTGQPILAFVSSSNVSNPVISNNQFVVAFAQPGLLTQSSSSAVRCNGSPLPSTITLANLFAKPTSFFSTRVTEGFASSFQPKDAVSDTGTRILVRYSGFPPGARLFVPDFVAGSSAVQPTAGGDLGVAQSGGQYAPSATGSLLLVRVTGADASGAGGTLISPVPAMGTTSFTSASEVTLSDGAGNAVYEVADANPAVRESAQFPTFVGLAPTGGGSFAADAKVSLAPLSAVNTASEAPVPRFTDVPPQSDCSALGDCNAAYFPQLFVDAPPLEFTSAVGGGRQLKYARVLNHGGGLLNWTATVSYQNGSGWLMVTPETDINNATLFVNVYPSALAAGTYQATITVDGGPLAGTKTLPVTLAVAGGSTATGPVIGSVVNAASFQPVPLVPGSLATITGSNLSGSSVVVTFDIVPAKLLYTSSTQINLQVPAEMAMKASAQMMVTVDGHSAAQTVPLAAVAPAIFAGGVLNQDNTPNSALHPAARGSVIQIFATGLASPGSGAISARIQDRDILAPNYAGAAPGIPGVQQVNIQIPADLGVTTANVSVCAVGSDPSQRVCSPAVHVALE